MPKVPRKLTDVSNKRIPEGCIHEYRCSICTHPERNDIDDMLIDGTHTVKDIAEEYDLKSCALYKHKSLHLSAAMLASAKENAKRHADGILDRLASREAKLNTSYERTGNTTAAKIALEHAQGYLKATGNWHESHGLDIRGNMQLSPGEQRDQELLDWLQTDYPDIYTLYQERCAQKLLAQVSTDGLNGSD
jgi:hypothetical protein